MSDGTREARLPSLCSWAHSVALAFAVWGAWDHRPWLTFGAWCSALVAFSIGERLAAKPVAAKAFDSRQAPEHVEAMRRTADWEARETARFLAKRTELERAAGSPCQHPNLQVRKGGDSMGAIGYDASAYCPDCNWRCP